MKEAYIRREDLLRAFDEEMKSRKDKRPITGKTMYRALKRIVQNMPVVWVEDDKWVVRFKGWW